ncbi:DUF6776 family protein [Castellaniella sp.]|uniref:DUF6776 family protein n=1 Tax=Castellaniella sp. TaxID=1955812 RepID=UPI002AFFCFC2|nr:DUF6776 family protein [Castellaniella sp.]
MSKSEKSGGLSRWLVRKLSFLLLLALVFLAGAATMHLGMHAGDQDMIRAQQAQLAALQADLTQSRADLAATRSQADVQSASQRTLQDTMTSLQQQLGQVRDQLAFYEQLIPPGPAGAVAIRAFDIQAEGDQLRYRVLLTRNAPVGADAFKGRMRFVAQGQSQGKPVRIDLSPLSASDAAATTTATDGSLALAFDQFQRSTGVLQVPADLQIQHIRLEILEGDTVRASQDTVLNRTAPSVQEPQS